MSVSLRPYQNDVIDDLTTAAANGAKSLLLVAPTGSGKTCIASKIVKHAADNGHFVLFLAHRRELVKQAMDKLSSFGVESTPILSGEFWDKSIKVAVASIQTLHSWVIRRRVEGLPPADLLIIDEAHHSNSSKTWREIIDAYPNALKLGMTATPCNRRGRGLGHFFDAMIKTPSIAQLTEQGYLVPVKYFCPSLPDLKGVKVTAGDYNEKQLEAKMDSPKLIGDVLENWTRIAPSRQTIVFASGIKHSLHLAESFKSIGIKAAHVDGFTASDVRDGILKDFSAGKIQVLCNCAVFTEGVDLPTASCLVFARPTKSLLLYLQVAGRVLRTCPGKTDCIIIDHAGVLYEHGPVAQDFAWKLDYGEGDVRQETRKGHVIKRDITCVQCKHVYWGVLACPECGAIPQVQGKSVETYPAYLEALDAIENPKEDRKSWYLQFLGYARERNKKDGFAFFKFQDKFPGEKPPYSWSYLEPIAPGLEVLAFIKIRNIAWAKSRYNTAKAPTPPTNTWAWKS